MVSTLQLKSLDDISSTTESRLTASYQRCESIGLSPHLIRARDTWEQRKLAKLLEKNADLTSFARILFANTFRWLPDQETVFILTDAHGRIIEFFSNPAMLAACSHIGVCAGGSLGEESIGTTSVALALHDLEPSIVYGDQHFCRILYNWYCVAIPLRDTDDQCVGCLNISCRQQSLGEKLALANFLAKELENYYQRNSTDKNYNYKKIYNAISSTICNVNLTGRQKQVLVLFSQGLSYKQIAKKMGVQSVKAIENHLDAVRRKLAATSRRECIQKAIKMGLL